MTVVLTVLSCVAALALLLVVAINLVRIIHRLEAIGGTSTSGLAKLRFGLRAIETQTGHLAPEVTQINGGLRALDGGMRAVEADLSRTASNLDGGVS